jgi:hypothetical protein
MTLFIMKRAEVFNKMTDLLSTKYFESLIFEWNEKASLRHEIEKELS